MKSPPDTLHELTPADIAVIYGWLLTLEGSTTNVSSPDSKYGIEASNIGTYLCYDGCSIGNIYNSVHFLYSYEYLIRNTNRSTNMSLYAPIKAVHDLVGDSVCLLDPDDNDSDK